MSKIFTRAVELSPGATLTRNGVTLIDSNGNFNVPTTITLSTGDALVDDNSNELLKFSSTASAVNELTITNSATGNAPELSVTGGDTNVSMKLSPKGTGIVQFGGVASTASAVAGAATANAQVSVITSEALTTAADGTYTLTLTNNKVLTSSACFVKMGWGTNSQGRPVVENVTPGSGSLVIVVRNYAAATALNGTLKFHVLVL
jgi:hypothetical protein